MDKKQRIDAITKALGYTENGGKPDLSKLSAGKSGELKSIFQFTPATWKLYSKQVLGKDAPIDPDTETYVVQTKVGEWYDQLEKAGTPPDEIPLKIGSMWNAGEDKPDAYKENWKGTNKYGVKYDTPAYAKKVADYTKEFESDGGSSVPQEKTKIATKTTGGNIGLMNKNPIPNIGSAPNSIGGLLQTALKGSTDV